MREAEIDLSDKTTTIDNIYTKMMRNVYKKFTLRKKIKFEEGKFLEITKSVGKLALQTLTSNNLLLQRKEVIETVEDAAFEYGFFLVMEVSDFILIHQLIFV